LKLSVTYQSEDRLSVNIQPSHIDNTNASWYILDSPLVPLPGIDDGVNTTASENDLTFVWGNNPTFYFSVIRKSTGDVVFSTEGSVLVYEDQFIEFLTAMPEAYNVYGLGERIHGLRLGNNFTATIYAADTGDPIDYNIYGSHPFYLDTRYFKIDDSTGEKKYIGTDNPDPEGRYESYSHGVFLRNAHGQEVVLKAENITWRTLGGSIDLYFFDGPSQPEVTKQYQDVIGYPAMQQYWTYGYHQCRWGYKNWSMLQDVVDNFRKFDIPLETIWTDIDYMNQYRDFTTDNNTFPVPEGQAFLEKLHAAGQHYIPIVDSAIYIPNPENASDAYATFNRGNESGVFLLNPDGSIYIGSVWPGYTVFPDWRANDSVSWWANEIATWHQDIPFDGIWIDMSEVSSFCVGSCGSGNLTLNPVHPPFKLPGEPGNVQYDYPEGFNITNSTEAASVSAASASQSSSTAAKSPTVTMTGPTSYLRTTPTPGVRNVDHPPYVINSKFLSNIDILYELV
jgi:alpha-glucosidase